LAADRPRVSRRPLGERTDGRRQRCDDRHDSVSTGDSEEGNGRENWSETISRQIYIALGKDGKLLTPDSSGYFTIPKAGLYQVSFGPQAVVGAPGTMIVCTI